MPKPRDMDLGKGKGSSHSQSKDLESRLGEPVKTSASNWNKWLPPTTLELGHSFMSLFWGPVCYRQPEG